MMLSILALSLQAAAPATPAPWTVTTKSDPATGAQSTLASQMTADGNAKLVLRCDVSKVKVVSLQLYSRNPLGGDTRDVAVTIDGAAPITDRWEFREKAAFNAADDAVTELAAALANARSVRVHTTNASGEPVDVAVVGPAGGNAVTTVLTACDYTLGEVPARAPQPAPTPPAK